MKSLGSLTVFTLIVQGAAATFASTGGIQNDRGLKVTVTMSVQRQTPKTDFRSVWASGESEFEATTLLIGGVHDFFGDPLKNEGVVEVTFDYLLKSSNATPVYFEAFLFDNQTDERIDVDPFLVEEPSSGSATLQYEGPYVDVGLGFGIDTVDMSFDPDLQVEVSDLFIRSTFIPEPSSTILLALGIPILAYQVFRIGVRKPTNRQALPQKCSYARQSVV